MTFDTLRTTAVVETVFTQEGYPVSDFFRTLSARDMVCFRD